MEYELDDIYLVDIFDSGVSPLLVAPRHPKAPSPALVDLHFQLPSVCVDLLRESHFVLYSSLIVTRL